MVCPKCKSKYTKKKRCSNDECILSTEPWVEDGYTFKENLKRYCWKTWYFRPKDLYYMIRSRFITRSYMVDTGLSKYNWCDKDQVLWLAMTKLFTDYVELEQAFEHVLSRPEDIQREYEDWEIEQGVKKADEEQIELYQKILDIYIMIKVVYPSVEKNVHDALHNGDSMEYYNILNRIYEYEGEIMTRIIAVRGAMWV